MDRGWESAARTGDALALSAALAAGAHPDARDRHGQTAIMLCAHAGHLDAVRVLVDAGADLDVTAKYGLSALMLAAIGGHAEVALLLVRSGADIRLEGTGAPGFAGKNAAALALESGETQLAAAIDALGAGA